MSSKHRIGASLVIVMALAAAAHADVTVGVFAPSSPFPSTGARVELANHLGEQVGAALGVKGVGKVYARGSDFAAAVKKGEVTVALVDAAYLATAGGAYTLIASGVRGGDTSHGWQLVVRGTDKIAQLKGKHVLVPAVGRETDFVLNVMLGSEVGRDFFGKIEAAPDTASALAAVGLGKADAAVVPDGVALPAGTSQALTLPATPGAVLVGYGLTAEQKKALVGAIGTYSGDATITGFRGADGDAVGSIARRFGAVVKRGPFAVPAVRLLVGDLVEGRAIAIERTPAASFAVGPERK